MLTPKRKILENFRVGGNQGRAMAPQGFGDPVIDNYQRTEPITQSKKTILHALRAEARWRMLSMSQYIKYRIIIIY